MGKSIKHNADDEEFRKNFDESYAGKKIVKGAEEETLKHKSEKEPVLDYTRISGGSEERGDKNGSGTS